MFSVFVCSPSNSDMICVINGLDQNNYTKTIDPSICRCVRAIVVFSHIFLKFLCLCCSCHVSESFVHWSFSFFIELSCFWILCSLIVLFFYWVVMFLNPLLTDRSLFYWVVMFLNRLFTDYSLLFWGTCYIFSYNKTVKIYKMENSRDHLLENQSRYHLKIIDFIVMIIRSI